MIQLYLGPVRDILAESPFNEFLIGFLLVEHLLPELEEPLLVGLDLHLLFFLSFLEICLRLEVHLLRDVVITC